MTNLDGVSVGQTRNLITPGASIVNEAAPLIEVAKIIVGDPNTRTVYVVDESKKLKGMISLNTLIEYVLLEDLPQQQYMSHLGPYHILEAIHAKKAADIMVTPIYVKDSDDVKSAFKTMFENKLEELPVVDDDMKVVGELDMLEILTDAITQK